MLKGRRKLKRPEEKKMNPESRQAIDQEKRIDAQKAVDI